MADPIVTRQMLVDYLRIQTTSENDVLDDIVERAIGDVETSIGKSVTEEDVTWYDDTKSQRLPGAVTALLLGYVPVGTLVVKDADGATVDASSYTIRQDLGLIVAAAGVTFSNGPYTITGKAGFSHSATYDTREKPALQALIIDYAAFLYQQRTPGARVERAAGTAVEYEIDDETGLPKRIARGCRRWRGPVFARQ